MKNLIILIPLIFIVSCNSMKNFKESPACPEGFDCYAEVITNKSIKILEDTTGQVYVRLNNNVDFNTIKYVYEYKGRPEISDDAYQEVIYFQVPVNKEKMEVKGNGVSDLKMVVGKSCFCVGAGYELVKQGNLKFEKKDKTYYINLNFESTKDININTIQIKASY